MQQRLRHSPKVGPYSVNKRGFSWVRYWAALINDGNTVAWFDYDDLSTITKDGANRVSVWADKSGNSHDLLQATGADQPLYQSSGLLFDGVSEFMQTAAFTYEQPEMIYIVFKQVTWIYQGKVLDGVSGGRGAIVQTDSSPELLCFAGVESSVNDNLALDTWGIARVLFNGASSSFQIDETMKLTGYHGDIDMGGFTLGARQDIVQFGNIEVKEVILRNVADSEATQDEIYNYLKSANKL